MRNIHIYPTGMEVVRTHDLEVISSKLKVFPAVAILGPRQCGKTTLARQYASRRRRLPIHSFDLEDPRDLIRLENPLTSLASVKGLTIIDEIQRRPELFPVLRVLIDKQGTPGQFLILGSASRDLIAQSSETLAGRICYLELGGFDLDLVGPNKSEQLWLRGGFPRSFLAATLTASSDWRESFIRTFLERDIPNLGLRLPPLTLRKFWAMLAHYHGQIFNASEIGKSLQISDSTAKRYLEIMTGTFMVRQLAPWFYNTKKRLIKNPKIFFRDSGLLHTLLQVKSQDDLHRHPRLGASWEGFALEQVIRQWDLKEDEVFFWGVHGGAELDLFFQRGGKSFGVEFKYNDAPRKTPSMQSAVDELGLQKLWVIYPGDTRYTLGDKISAVPLKVIAEMPDHEW